MLERMGANFFIYQEISHHHQAGLVATSVQAPRLIPGTTITDSGVRWFASLPRLIIHEAWKTAHSDPWRRIDF